MKVKVIFWDDTYKNIELRDESVEDLIWAVRGQYLFIDTVNKISIDGRTIKQVERIHD